MRKKLSIFVFGVGMFLLFGTFALGADTITRIISNDQDTLIFGVITQVDDHEISIEVINHLVGVHDLTRGAGARQLRPETVRLARDERVVNFQLGDYVFASLNQAGELFTVAWGIYPVTTVMELDWEMWHVETGHLINSIILSDFLNQEGLYTYSVNEGRVIRHQGDADIVIHDPNPPGIQPRIGPSETEQEDEELTELETDAIVEDEFELDLSNDEVFPEEGVNTPTLVIAGVAATAIIGAALWLFNKKSK